MTVNFENDIQFAEALDACSRRLKAGEDAEKCLADYPVEYRDELARLTPLSLRLAFPGTEPSPQFQASLEQRLLSAVDAERKANTGFLRSLKRVFLGAPLARAGTVAMVCLLVLGGSGFGVVQAAQDTLPDSPLYQVKTATEWAELALTSNQETQVAVYAKQINQRGRELQQSVQANKPKVVDRLGVSLSLAAERIVDRALVLMAQGNTRPARRAHVAIQNAHGQLNRLIGQAQPETAPALQKLQGFLDQQDNRLIQARPRNATRPRQTNM